MPGGAPRSSMIPLSMRGIPWQDQVLRQQAFEQAHPEVTISYLSTAWQAAVPDGDMTRYVTRFELKDLLDVLEALSGPP